MKKLVLFFALCYSITTFSQNPDTQALIPVQGYGINLLNSRGNSSIDNDISNIGFMNPAAISNFNFNFGAGLSYQLSSEMKEGWIADIGVKRINDWMPQSGGVLYKLSDLSIGVAFGQKFNGELFTGPILITTTQNPDGTGEYWEAIIRSRVQFYSVIASYSFPEIFDESSSLQVGFRYSYNHLKHTNSFYYQEVTENDNASSYSFGFQYSNKLSENRNLRIGFAYEIETEFEKQFKYEPVFIYDLDSTGRIPSFTVINYRLVGKIPDRFNIDVSADLSELFRLNAMVTGVLWEAEYDALKNQLEFSASGIYKINEMFSPSFGFYYTDKNYDENIFDVNEKLDALFITAGLRINIQNYYADFAIADSHLFSGDFRKQTIGKLAIGVHL